MATKHKSGTPSQYSVKVQPYLEQIARYVQCGVTEGQLCDYYGVGKTQWAQYKKDNPELAETLCKAKKEHKTELINAAHRVAVGYEYEEKSIVEIVDAKGGITTKTTTHKKHAKPDAGMLMFLLINRYHDEFARDPQILEIRRQLLELQKKQAESGGNMSGV